MPRPGRLVTQWRTVTVYVGAPSLKLAVLILLREKNIDCPFPSLPGVTDAAIDTSNPISPDCPLIRPLSVRGSATPFRPVRWRQSRDPVGGAKVLSMGEIDG